MIAEFIGIPGAGKTTTRKDLLKNLKFVNERKCVVSEEAFYEVAKSNTDLIYRCALNLLPKALAIKLSKKLINRTIMQFEAQNLFLAEWNESFEIFLSSHEIKQLSVFDRQLVIASYLETAALHEAITKNLANRSIVFFDEGLVHKSLMFISARTDENSDKTNVIKYLDSTPMPDIIIAVHANIKECYNRITNRNAGLPKRYQNLGSSEIKKFLKITEEHFKIIIDWLKKNKRIRFFEIDNNQSSQFTTITLKSQLENMLKI